MDKSLCMYTEVFALIKRMRSGLVEPWKFLEINFDLVPLGRATNNRFLYIQKQTFSMDVLA